MSDFLPLHYALCMRGPLAQYSCDYVTGRVPICCVIEDLVDCLLWNSKIFSASNVSKRVATASHVHVHVISEWSRVVDVYVSRCRIVHENTSLHPWLKSSPPYKPRPFPQRFPYKYCSLLSYVRLLDRIYHVRIPLLIGGFKNVQEWARTDATPLT